MKQDKNKSSEELKASYLRNTYVRTYRRSDKVICMGRLELENVGQETRGRTANNRPTQYFSSFAPY